MTHLFEEIRSNHHVLWQFSWCSTRILVVSPVFFRRFNHGGLVTPTAGAPDTAGELRHAAVHLGLQGLHRTHFGLAGRSFFGTTID